MEQTPHLPLVYALSSAFLSGITIVFGTIVYLSCPDKVIGSVLFSFALMTIVCRGLLLYTGKIGYVKKFGWRNIGVTLAGNAMGAITGGYIIRFTRIAGTLESNGIIAHAQTLIDKKINDDPLSIFILSCCCGVMMFLAVDNYAKSKSWIFVIMPIMIFIHSGFEHCIANIAYFTIGNAWNAHVIWYTCIMIVGNGIGSWLYLICRDAKKQHALCAEQTR